MINVHVSGHLKDYTGKMRDFELPDEQDISHSSCVSMQCSRA